MEALDVFIPEIIRGASDWIEDRYGRFAGRVAFIGFLLAVPLLAAIVVIAFLMIRGG